MKRSAPLKRGKPLARRKPVKSVNRTRQAKRAKAYATYLASPVWKAKRAEAMERAGHQCEFVVEEKAVFWTWVTRCPEMERLQVHHARYPKVLGTESVDTLLVLCKTHHELVEAAKWWKR